MTFEIRVACSSCLVEGARIEMWDPEHMSHAVGMPVGARCRLCGHSATFEFEGREGRLVDQAPPRTFAGIDDVRAALLAWSQEEALGSAEDLVDVYFVLRTVTEVAAALERREPIETTFDVADYLFSGGAAGATGGIETAERVDEAYRHSRPSMPPSIRPIGSPRDELLAIASVAAADGEASADDLVVLSRAAEKRGLPPLGVEDIRVWRAAELPPPNTLVDRERVLEEMFQMGWSDGQMDESELRVIRDYARAWGIDPERLREWTELYSLGDSNRVERWFRRIGLFLFPAR